MDFIILIRNNSVDEQNCLHRSFKYVIMISSEHHAMFAYHLHRSLWYFPHEPKQKYRWRFLACVLNG